MSGSVGRFAYQLGFQISPIILVGGIAPDITGGYLPLVAITEAANFVEGLLAGGGDISLDNFFCHFRPLSGSTLIDQQLGAYPLANQVIASNATIQQPLRVSMQMICPVKSAFGYATKLATMMMLQATFSQHNTTGGTYIVATPSYIYNNCVMRSMRDTSPAVGAQVQTHWQLDFELPLLTMNQADQVQGTLMSRLTGGLPSDGTISGVIQTAGNPLSGVSGALPSTTGLPSAIQTAPTLSGY